MARAGFASLLLTTALGCITSHEPRSLPPGSGFGTVGEGVLVGRIESVHMEDGAVVPTPPDNVRHPEFVIHEASGEYYDFSLAGPGRNGLFVVPLPAGPYRFVGFLDAFPTEAVWIRFDVEPGRVRYVGTFRFEAEYYATLPFRAKRGWAGTWTVVDEAERDLADFRQKYPALADSIDESLAFITGRVAR